MKTRKIMALVLSIVMVFSLCSTAFAAHLTDEITELESENSDLSMYIATQSYVLLENNGVLPLEETGSVALFGNGVVATVKGGTGSGAVNNRANDNVYSAFVDAGWEIANPTFVATQTTSLRGDRAITDEELAEATANTDLALYVISRQAGEGSDRQETSATGSFTLTEAENANIALLAENFDRFVVVYNTCMMDTDAVRANEGVDAVFFMSNGGQRGSEALVKVLTGEYTPSGKLTDTWALDLSGEYGYPSSDMGFSWMDGNTDTEWYNDGIYVGYRYFDTWGLPVAYEFGFGLSYTEFAIDIADVAIDEENVEITVDVTNVGGTYSGKEVVQVYFSAPDGETEKPYQELAAYGKTDELAPGQKQSLTLTYATTDMSSYCEDCAAYVMDAGEYIIRVGNSSRNTQVAAVVTLDETKITEQLSHQVVPEVEIEEISKEGQTPITYAGEAAEIAAAPVYALAAADLPYANNASPYDDETVTTYLFAEDATDYDVTEETTLTTKTVAGILNNYEEGVGGYSTTTYSEEVEIVDPLPDGYTKENVKLTDVYDGIISLEQFVASMTVEEMARLTVGPGWGGGGATTAPDGNLIGSSASSVQGGAGQTTQELFYTRYIPSMPNADGPAGIRITQQYTQDGVRYYQYCTAFPAGSCYVMSWDFDLIMMEGAAIGKEMQEYGVTTWLAPGMNIHRNPICGRNFEYYSEDPLVTGVTAGYMAAGVQATPGIGVTLKHYWGNQQENNRNAENNVISERASREIYLKGFEIAIKIGQPQCIMTSYNCNNGWPAADSYDICTDLARGEWGFKGLVMTDWGGGQSTQYISMHAGNDLIMPGDASISVVTDGLVDVEAEWNDDGYVAITETSGCWGGVTYEEAWNEFVPAAGGSVKYEVPVVGGYEAINENVWDYVDAGAAMVHAAEDGSYSVVWSGDYAGNIVLGDLQKATMNILNVIMQSQDMAKLYADAPFYRDIELVPYSEANGALITEGWAMATKGEIANVGIVADTVTIDSNVDTQAVVNLTYEGDVEITSARIDINSELAIAEITSDYDIAINDGYVVIYTEEGSVIDGVLCTVTYDTTTADGWRANGEYPVDVYVVDATGDDTEQITIAGVDGAVIMDNDYHAGDANLDGRVSTADLIVIARYLVDLIELDEVQLAVCDVDGDYEVDNSDLIRVARGIVEGDRIDEAIGSYTVVVEGYDWGAASTKVIVDLNREIDADSVEAADFNVLNTMQGCRGSSTSTRRVTDAYVSDAEGNEVAEDSNYVALELYVSPNEGGAFYYNMMGSGHNVWPDPYYFTIDIASYDGIKYSGVVIDKLTLGQNPEAIVCPLADEFVQTEFTSSDDIVLNYGAWSPEEDDAQNPLIIWLHGAGEGGTDNDVVVMGNKVVNLITDEIQQYFTTDEISGAYVLTPQSPTMWMNDGTGNYTSDGTSMYTEALMELIESYVAGNPDIDTDRIYIGGCSNGGFMTMNMIMAYPEYFAAAYPICEAYTDEWITDEQIEAIKDIPIWFTHAANDTTVRPATHTVATYDRLVAAGAENVHFSYFDDVHDTTGEYNNADGTPYQYMGHWSWIYTLNNECVEEDGTTIMEWLAAQEKA